MQRTRKRLRQSDRVYEQTQKAALNCNYLGHIDLDQTVSVTVTVARRDRSTL